MGKWSSNDLRKYIFSDKSVYLDRGYRNVGFGDFEIYPDKFMYDIEGLYVTEIE